MAYRFGAKLSVSREIRRIFAEEAANAVACLGRSEPDRRDENIHEARKSVKKLRALLRLLAPQWPKRLAQAERKALRNIGRQLSEFRDAQAVTEAFDKVSGDLGVAEEMVRAGSKFLADRKNRIMADVETSIVMRGASKELAEAARRVRTHKLRPGGFAVIESGLKRSYKRGRKARIAAKNHSTGGAFHNWRKRVKEHWYHSRLLSEVDSKQWNARIENLKTLEGLLGDDHNLAVLAEIFKTEETLEPICEKLNAVSRQLRAEALKTGKGLYKQKWSAVANELGDAHSVWPARIVIRKGVGREQSKAKVSAVTA